MVGIGTELLCLIGDAAIVAIFYRAYKRCHEAALQVKTAPSITCGSELDSLLQKHDGNMAYACVEGVVAPVGHVLKSQYKDDITGVMQKLVLVEHKSKRTQGFWSDVHKVLRNTMNTVPFVLSLPKTALSSVFETEHQVHIQDPVSASLLEDSLTETHAHFEADSASMFSRGMDRIFGDVTKGIQETEHMLPVGASLLGLGRVMVESSKIKMVPPTNGANYILTALSKTEVIKILESREWWYKVFVGVFGTVGIAIFIIWIKRVVCQWKERRDAARQQEELEMARLQRISRNRRRSSDGNTSTDGSVGRDHSDSDPNSSCVICLSQERDIVLLNCGHICLCADCAQALPIPRKCPICRSRVDRMLPVYNA